MTVRCEQLPGKDINIFRFDENSSEKLRSTYRDVANALIDAGINSYDFSIYCMNSPEAAETLENSAYMEESGHIPDIQHHRSIYLADNVVLSAHISHGNLQEYVDHQDEPKAMVIAVR